MRDFKAVREAKAEAEAEARGKGLFGLDRGMRRGMQI